MLVKMRDRVAKLKAEGKSADQAAAAKPFAADIQVWAKQDDMASDRVVHQIYASLK